MKTVVTKIRKMAAPCCMTRLLNACRRFECAFVQWIGLHPTPGFQAALISDVHPVSCHQHPSSSQSSKSLLEEIFDSTLFAVPKSRRTLQIRRTRKMMIKGHFEYALPKTNIVACLDCGHWHEKDTICGHCYKKVEAETQEMKDAMGIDALKYEAPHSEVVFLYEGEQDNRPTYKGKYIVEMKKPKPQWFSKNLLTKSHTPVD